MRLPSKVTSYNDSSLPTFVAVLEALKESDYTPADLYKKLKRRFSDVGEFVETLDDLYILEKIELIPQRRVIHYVEKN